MQRGRTALTPAGWRRLAGLLAGALAIPVGAGCHKATPGSAGDGSGDKTPPPAVDLVVDANRDGRLDLVALTDEPGKNGFAPLYGAVVLANLDDDNADGLADATTDAVDGDADTADLAPLAIRGYSGAPDGATGLLSVDGLSSAHVRLFRVSGSPDRASSYAAIADPHAVTLNTDDVRAGVLFALEARAFVGTTDDAWDGHVQLTLDVADKTGKSLGHDLAQLRVAPVLFQWNTAPTRHVYFSDGADATRSLADGIAPVCVGGATREALQLGDQAFDQWTQDFFDVGYTSRPGPDGKPVGLKVIIRSAQPDRLAGEVMVPGMLGPDLATLFIHGPPMNDAAGHGYSMNSFGNWDVVPPYTKGAETYPLGRNIWGEGDQVVDQPDPAYAAFVRAQAVQPPINVDSSWLVVGHVDEFLSWVRTNTPRGWGMLAGSPRLARQMLLDLKAAGHGSAVLFEGLQDYDFSQQSEPLREAAVTVDEVLANADVMAESQKAQVAIDAAVAKVQTEVGLADAEITPMPSLFERVYGDGLAYQPGTVNLLHVDGKVAVPKPFGPRVDGKDPFEEDLTTRLGALGLEVHFADDWETYHVNMGEVHCGTNVSRDLSVAWWESGR